MKVSKMFSCVFFVFFVCFTACKMDVLNSDDIVIKTGTLCGKAYFQNAEDNSTIQIMLDKTDGLRTASVMENSGIYNSCYSGKVKQRSIVSYSLCDKDGSYYIDNLEPGVYTIYALSNESTQKAVYCNVTVIENENVVVPDLELTATGSLSGKISIEIADTTSSGFMVFVAGTNYMSLIDSDGNFTINDIPAGDDYEIVIMYGTYIYYWKSDVCVKPFETSYLGEKNITESEYKDFIQKEKGIDGKDGTPIIWKGSFESAEKIQNPQYLWAYYNTSDGCSYIYDGEKWTLLASYGMNNSKYEIRTTNIPIGDNEYPLGGVKVEVLLDGVVVKVKVHSYSKLMLINYEVNGGYFIAEPNLYCVDGSDIELSIPQKEGYVFVGWYYDEKFTGNKIEKIKDDGTKTHVTVYAKWISDVEITYELNGGVFDGITPITSCKYGEEINIKNFVPKKEGYGFVGWYYDKKFTGNKVEKVKIDETIIIDNETNKVIVYAGWLPDVEITYELNGGVFDGITPITVCKYGEEINIKNFVPKKEGFIFNGWYNYENFIGNKIEIVKNNDGSDIKVYAKWITNNSISDYLLSLQPSNEPYLLTLTENDINDDLRDFLQSLDEGIYINLELKDGITCIKKEAFDSCSCITSITIPNSVTSICDHAFYQCSGLKNIIIPDSVVSIGNQAFSGGWYSLSNLETIKIGKSVISIGDNVFEGCCKIKSIEVDVNNPKYDSRNGCNALIETSTNTLIKGCKNSILPEDVTYIADNAFFGIEEISEIKIPDSVTFIGDSAFQGCPDLTKIVIGKNVKMLGVDVFYLCESLHSIVFNDPENWCQTSSKNDWLNGENGILIDLSDSEKNVQTFASVNSFWGYYYKK